MIFTFKDITNWPKNIGIYAIFSLVDGKHYIGQTVNRLGFYCRWISHRKLLRENNHDNIYLQRSFNKHGEDNFVFKVLEICDLNDNLNLKEKYWMEKLKTMYFQHGWNIDNVDENGARRQDYRPEESQRIKSFKIETPDGKIIEGKNIRKFCRENDLDCANIVNLLNGKAESYRGYRSLHPIVLEKRNKRKRKVLSSTGEIHIFENIEEFARNNNFILSTFKDLIYGKRKEYRGWTMP